MNTVGFQGRLQHPAATERSAAATSHALGAPTDLDSQWGTGAGVPDEDLRAVAAVHLPQMLRYAAALTGDPQEAADVVERVLVRTRSRWRLGAPTMRADLHLRRLVLQEHRSRWRRRRPRSPLDPPGSRRTAGASGSDRRAVAADDPLLRSLRGLAPRDRAVLVLRYHEGLPDAESAAVLGTSPAAVSRRAARALAAVRTAAPAPPAPSTSTTSTSTEEQ